MPRLLAASLFALTLLALAPGAAAQTPPSEATIRSDAREHIKPGATVTVRGQGTREWNRGAYEFRRSITMRSDVADMPGVEVETYGDIVYQSHGNVYRYKGFNVGDWRYFGLPDPTAEEVEAVLMTDPAKAYPHGTLDQDRSLAILDGEETYWHSLESVTVKAAARSKQAISYTEVAEVETVMEVRLYREAVDAPWTRFITTRNSETRLGVETFTAEQVRAMRTLRDAVIIAGLEDEAAALPEVDVPEFRDPRALADYVYAALRGDDPAVLEATLLAVLAPRHFVAGSETALGIQARTQMVEPILTSVRGDGGAGTFAAQTCEQPRLNERMTSGSRYYYHSILTVPPRFTGNASVMQVLIEEAPGGYRNGQPLPGRLVVGDLKVYTSQKADDLAYVASFDDPAAKCPGGAAQAAQGAVQEAQSTVEDAVDRGRRALGRIFGRRRN